MPEVSFSKRVFSISAKLFCLLEKPAQPAEPDCQSKRTLLACTDDFVFLLPLTVGE